ncbi:MAG: ABC transporter substrate-binding protein [Firmicutes bacterium]|nr:ABC transporter substrate-binding protein [Bacillota bacterium]
MNLRRKTAALFLVILTVLALSTAALAKKQPVVVWGLNVYDPGTAAMVEKFNATNEKYEIIAEVPVGAAGQTLESMVKLMTAIASGTGPDVTTMDRFVVAGWALRGTLTPLNDLIERDGFDIGQYMSWAVEEVTLGDKYYGLPHNADSRAFYWNKDHFAEAGLDPDTPPATWDEFVDYALKLTKRDARGRLLRVGTYSSTSSWHYIHTFGLGGQFLSDDGRTALLNAPETVRGIEMIVDLIDKLGGVEELGTYTEGFAGYAEDSPSNPFLMEDVSMMLGQSPLVGTIARYKPELNFGIGFHPVLDPEVGPVTYGGGWAWVIPQGAKNLEGAWEVIKWLTTEGHVVRAEGDYEYNQSMGRPYVPRETTNIAVDTMLFEKYGSMLEHEHLRKALDVVLELYGKIRMRFLSPEGQLIRAQLSSAYEGALYHRGTAQELLDSANAVVQEALDKFWKDYDAGRL